MANKSIQQLPGAAVVSTDEYEKQVTAGGASQKCTAAQLLTFIQNNATAFAQNLILSGNLNAASGKWQILQSSGAVSFAGGQAGIDGAGGMSVGALDVGASNLVIVTSGQIISVEDIEITDTIKGLILKSPNGTRYRLKVDNAGQLGTIAA